jgi:DNA polymerase III epsilon subunit-like protein
MHADEMGDPVLLPEAVRLAERFAAARARHGRIMLHPMGGSEIGIAGMLNAAGFRLVDYVAPERPAQPDDFVLEPGAAGGIGLAFGAFKALQLLSAEAAGGLSDFVAFDLETTDNDADSAEIVEIAAARVRDWKVVDEFHTLVRPRIAIAAGATRTHGYVESDVAEAPAFDEVWPRFRAFVGSDTLIAHNGNQFDFPILYRLARETGAEAEFVTYDTLPLARWLRLGSAKLQMLAERFGVDPGDPHKALSDVRTLVGVFAKLEEEKIARARRVGLANVLDHLAIALALSDPETLTDEATLLLDIGRAHALGRYTTCLDFYAGERPRTGGTAATVDELIERLGGHALMQRVRAEKRPSERYPAAMARVRRLMEGLPDGDLELQIEEFLGRVALSRSDGPIAEAGRVNLLTLHATKGLEFSRVYIVGTEDTELPGGPGDRAPRPAELEEARRLLYVGMTRARDRLVLTRTEVRGGRPTGGHRFLEEMGLTPEAGS